MNPARLAGVLLLAAFATGCATLPAPESTAAGVPPSPARAAVKSDPWEAFNRKVFAFNESVDEAVLQPVAKAYRKVLPELVRTGIGNVIGNVGDAWSAANQFLQGKGQAGLEMTTRFATNTVFGIAGLLDIASEMGLERQSEDFGQTLGRWGVGAGPYIVLPLLGPSSLRETVALPVDRKASLSSLAASGTDTYAVAALEVVHARAALLSAGQLVNQIALDRYSFVRDAFLARRRSLVYDGNPPELPEDDPPEKASPPK